MKKFNKYAGLDVHKESIAVAAATSGSGAIAAEDPATPVARRAPCTAGSATKPTTLCDNNSFDKRLMGYLPLLFKLNSGGVSHHIGTGGDFGRIVSDKVLMSDLDPHDIFKGVQYIRRWMFMPLRVDRRAIWFRIVVAAYATLYRVHHLHRPLYQSETRCNPPMLGERHWQFNGVMPHWVLYRLAGHHPLAVLLAYGHEPDPDAAQAVALYLSSLVGRHHE